MSSVMSPVEKIDDLYFHPLPNGRLVRLAKAVRVKNLTVALGANGKLYAHGAGFRDRVCYAYGEWPWTDAMMRALCKLGVITPEQRDWHIAGAREHSRQLHRRIVAKSVASGISELGIELTKAQREKLAEYGS